MSYKAILLALLFASCTSALAQEPKGKIVLFREHHFSDNNFNPPVFCDGVLLGRMVGGTYLEVSASAGTHQCVAESLQLPVASINARPDRTVYLRVDIKGDLRKHAVLATVPDREYFSLKSKLMPLSAGVDLKSPPVEPPAQAEPSRAASDSAGGDSTSVDSERVTNGEITAPKCVYCPSPDYSKAARKAKFEGMVVLRAVIHKDGHVTVTKVMQTSGYKDLDDAAVAAVTQWRLKPALDNKDGTAIDVALPIEIQFRLLH